MKRVSIIVEGPTEEAFIEGPFYQALVPYGVFVRPIILGVPGHKGGRVKYERVKKDILRTLKQDQEAYCSTLFDLYGLGDGFPGQGNFFGASGADRVVAIENAILEEMIRDVPDLRPDNRLIPYLQPYEFEGLLFSNPSVLAASMFRTDLEAHFQAISRSVESPEDINDSPQTAPSKRILSANPAYIKPISGTLAAEGMGIQTIRNQCPHFRQWFDKLANLDNLSSQEPLVD